MEGVLWAGAAFICLRQLPPASRCLRCHLMLSQTYHWNEKRKIDEYYHTLAKIQAAPKEEEDS